MADGIGSSSGYFIPQLKLLSICACMSSVICIPILCSLFFLLFFLDYLIIESPKSNTLLSPLRHRGVVIPVPCAGWWECQCSVERVMAVWISNVSLGWSLCPCRYSQLGAGSSRCLIWARTSSLTQPFCAGKSMLTGTKRTALSSSATQPCPGCAKAS